MAEPSSFAPAWASPPGHTIADLLKERAIEAQHFAVQLGCTQGRLENLLLGNERIDQALAERLADVLGASAGFWVERDAQYCADVERLTQADAETAMRDWLKLLPTKDMKEWAWIDGHPQSSKELARACLEFFDVDSVADWNSTYASVSQLVAFRRSEAYQAVPSVVAAWLRKGEIEAHKISCAPFDRDRLTELLPELKRLTRVSEPAEFLPPLVAMCASAGVAVVVVRAPAKCGVSGAARFIKSDKALVQLSFRYRSDDHFWFTLFHELAHLILHGRDAFFLEGNGLIETHEEEEANAYSASTLIADAFVHELQGLGSDYRKVMRFAKRAGVSPGIVVGQLQHRGLIPRNYLNKLKVRYAWRD